MFDQAIYRIMNAPIQSWPFPHIYITDLFEDYRKFYSALIAPHRRWIPLNKTGRVTANYNAQRFIDPDAEAFLSQRFPQLNLEYFGRMLMNVFGIVKPPNDELRDERLLIEDRPGYALGPHTDSPSKVISCLFYLPVDDRSSHLGTSFYVPKAFDFRCKGGPHYPVEKFVRVMTFPYVPNSMLAFVKSDVSFHGVEPFTAGVRQLLLYDIRVK